jgi:hypothetical protein
MRKIVSIAPVLVLVLGITSADARRHGHFRLRYWEHAPRAMLAPLPYRVGRLARAYARAPGPELPPSGWQLQPADPNWQGKRYVSPGGEAWLAFYSSPADLESVSQHLKTVAFVDGEEIVALHSDRNELFVTGTTGVRMFYRKARLACGGRQWHHVALEFPLGDQQNYRMVIAQAAQVLDQADGSGCTAPDVGE